MVNTSLYVSIMKTSYENYWYYTVIYIPSTFLFCPMPTAAANDVSARNGSREWSWRRASWAISQPCHVHGPEAGSGSRPVFSAIHVPDGSDESTGMLPCEIFIYFFYLEILYIDQQEG